MFDVVTGKFWLNIHEVFMMFICVLEFFVFFCVFDPKMQREKDGNVFLGLFMRLLCVIAGSE